MNIWAIFLLCLSVGVEGAPKNPLRPTMEDYCMKPINTPCKYKCKRDSERCGPETLYKYRHFTHTERQFVLRRHNELRNKLAGGGYKDFGFPQAADMMVMSWDKECEWMTACYALQCTWAHDEMRQPVAKPYPHGQNLYRIRSNVDYNKLNDKFYNNAINAWFDEYKLVNEDHIKMLLDKFVPVEKPMIGHFTQFAWADSRFLGCAKYKFYGEKQFQLFYFCNYYPPGNYRGRKMYTAGKPASKCPNGTKHNSKYKNLCGKIRDVRNDNYRPPIDFDPAGTKKELKRIKAVEEEERRSRSVWSWGSSGGASWGLAAPLLAVLILIKFLV